MGYDVAIERAGLSAVIDLQGEASVLAAWCGDALPPFPDRPNTANRGDGLSLYWIGPERWLLRAGVDREDELLASTRPAAAPDEVSIVLISDTLEFFALSGPDAGEIVSIASPLDHRLPAFPENGVSFTELFGIKGLLLRRDDGFEIAVERSYGDMFEDYLLRANS